MKNIKQGLVNCQAQFKLDLFKLKEQDKLDKLDELDDLDAQRCISVQAVAPSILFRLAGWTTEVIIMLSQLLTKLKLKLSLAITKYTFVKVPA